MISELTQANIIDGMSLEQARKKAIQRTNFIIEVDRMKTNKAPTSALTQGK